MKSQKLMAMRNFAWFGGHALGYASLVIKWCMTRLEMENGHQKDMCYNEIGSCAQ